MAWRAIEKLLDAPREPAPPPQQEYLRDAMERLRLTMNELALHIDATPRAMKNWLLPDTSPSHRTMPALARTAIDDLLSKRGRKQARKSR